MIKFGSILHQLGECYVMHRRCSVGLLDMAPISCEASCMNASRCFVSDRRFIGLRAEMQLVCEAVTIGQRYHVEMNTGHANFGAVCTGRPK